MSWPAAGKHLRFDGRLLHAALADLLEERAEESEGDEVDDGCDEEDEEEEEEEDDEEEEEEEEEQRQVRVTFLVNIWLDHRPSQCRACPLADWPAPRRAAPAPPPPELRFASPRPPPAPVAPQPSARYRSWRMRDGRSQLSVRLPQLPPSLAPRSAPTASAAAAGEAEGGPGEGGPDRLLAFHASAPARVEPIAPRRRSLGAVALGDVSVTPKREVSVAPKREVSVAPKREVSGDEVSTRKRTRKI